MAERNFSINEYFQRLATEHQPRFRFRGSTNAEWAEWRKQLLPELLQTLGKPQAKVPLRPEVLAEWQHEGLIKQRVVFDVDHHLSATAYVYRPANGQKKFPAIIACHGHGPFGKDPVMGVVSSEEVTHDIARHRYDYGLQLAKAGFAVIAIDWRGFGERDDRRRPRYQDISHGRDQCNVHFLRATILNRTLLGMNLHDASCALDYLTQQDFVDSDRVGAIGLSFGGTMATWLAIVDDRVKAADVVCYSDRFSIFGMRDANICGSQVTPGLFDLCDVPDLQGLIAPKPLLIEIGLHDTTFDSDAALSCYGELKKIYQAAAAEHRLRLDLFEGGHQWAGTQTVEFFRRALVSQSSSNA